MKKREVLFKGAPLTLVGRAVRVGDAAPEFRATSKDLKDVRLADFKGLVKVITSFPSIDTPVCDLQVKEFNKRAASLGPGVAVIGISKDLPFAQKRFCEAHDITNVRVVSDYLYSSFGINYGLLIKELNLLARAVLIVDADDVVRYLQVVAEITTPPDYEEALRVLGEVLKSPAGSPKPGPAPRCVPCEGSTPLLPKEEVTALAAPRPAWRLIEGKRLIREFEFKDSSEAKYFFDLIATLAEEQGHHPAVTLIWRKVKITITTHAAGGLTRNDFIMAGIIDGLEG
jgi:thiol peroxidase